MTLPARTYTWGSPLPRPRWAEALRFVGMLVLFCLTLVVLGNVGMNG